MPQPLVIKDWQKAVATSPHTGFALMRNVDIESFDGAVKTGKKPTTLFHTAYSSTFTAVAGTDVCTASATVPETGVAVTLTTTGTLPAGLTTGTIYFINKLSSTTFELCTTIANANAGTQIDITDTGTGTHTVTTVNAGTIKHIVNDPRTFTRFMQDSNGRVWYEDTTMKLLSGNTLTASAGNGIAILRVSDGSATYLFAFRNAAIDVINVFGTSNKETPVWSNSWQSLNTAAGSSFAHTPLNGQDSIIYFPDDRYVGSIRENSGSVFDPSSGATYTYNNQALDLPLGVQSSCLEELGTNLLIGASNDNRIFPWDRISDSYSLPLPVPEYNTTRMKNMGNIVYVLAGTKGNIYQTQGSYVRFFAQIPQYLVNNAGTLTQIQATWGGIAERNGALLVGVGTLTSGNSGVYLVYPDGRILQDNTPSTGSTNVTAIFAQSEFYYMGYSGGADNFSTSAYYSSFEGVVQSGLYRLATKTDKIGFSEVEVQIAKPVAGHARIKYRTDTTSAFDDFPAGAVSFTTTTGATSYIQDIGLTNLENLQVQVEVDGNIEVMEVRLIP